MQSRVSTGLTIALLLVAGVALYGTRLGEAPVYVMHDEAGGALQAQSIAATGRDLSGRLLPLYFTEPEFPPGRDPALIYVTALGLQLLPFSEAGVRTPTALVAVLNVILTFLVARRLFGSTTMGVVAAALLLLTPIHFIRGRMILSPLYTIPFVLGWLWSLARFDDQPSVRRLVGAVLWLGAGTYSYLAAVVMMPLYLAATLVPGYVRLGFAAALSAGLAFMATLAPMVAWYATHPERNTQIVSAYQLDTGALALVSRWGSLYWSFFDPAFLFITGDASLTNSTRTSGFFPLAFALLLPVGIIGLLRSRQPVPLAIAIGLLTAPVVSVISGAIEMNRVMFAIPFGVLTAAYGLHMLARVHRAGRVAAALLIAAMVWQFAGFHRDYFGTHRIAAAAWFSGNSRDAVRALMNHAGAAAGAIYVSDEIPWVSRIWRFYAIADGKPSMIERAAYVPLPPPDASPGALLLCPSTSERCRQDPRWQTVETITSVDGSKAFTILRRPQ